MKWHGVSINTGSDFVFTLPYIYADTAWRSGTYWIYNNGTWKMIGGACTLLIPFLTSNGSPVYVNGELLLVRLLYGAKLKDNGNNYLKDSEGKFLYSEIGG